MPLKTEEGNKRFRKEMSQWGYSRRREIHSLTLSLTSDANTQLKASMELGFLYWRDASDLDNLDHVSPSYCQVQSVHTYSEWEMSEDKQKEPELHVFEPCLWTSPREQDVSWDMTYKLTTRNWFSVHNRKLPEMNENSELSLLTWSSW